jgi:predicted nucleic acid-binding protein
VPAVVVAETWRGGYSLLGEVLAGCEVEPLTDRLARLAGLALGEKASSATVDAIVAASAAQRDDVLLTADPGDLIPFADVFRTLRVVVL